MGECYQMVEPAAYAQTMYARRQTPGRGESAGENLGVGRYRR